MLIRLNKKGAGKPCGSLRAREWYNQHGGQRRIERSFLHNDGRPFARLRVPWNRRHANPPNFTSFHRPPPSSANRSTKASASALPCCHAASSSCNSGGTSGESFTYISTCA